MKNLFSWENMALKELEALLEEMQEVKKPADLRVIHIFFVHIGNFRYKLKCPLKLHRKKDM